MWILGLKGLTGQSWCMLESWYTVGAQNKDCRTASQTDSAKNLVPPVPQAIMVHVPGTCCYHPKADTPTKWTFPGPKGALLARSVFFLALPRLKDFGVTVLYSLKYRVEGE